LDISEIIKLLSVNPAKILGLTAGRLNIGNSADIVIFDPNEKWVVNPSEFKSKARNTPFAGMELYGKVKYTIVQGKIVFEEGV
jgi:dihydroorotase